MQGSFTRAARLSAVALGTLGVMGAGAGIASADTLRQSTSSTAAPTASGAVVPVNTFVGGQLSGSASFTSPNPGSPENAGTRYSGSCTTGGLQGKVTANAAGSGAVTLQTNVAASGGVPASLEVRNCTDNNPNVDVAIIRSSNVVNASVASTGSGVGTITIPSNVTFQVGVTPDGATAPVTLCNVIPTGAITGSLNNSTGNVTFTSIRVYTTSTTSVCAQNIGSSATGNNNSLFSGTFGQIRTQGTTAGPITTTGNRVGIFAG